tara:strand:- start:212 stop:769 length:558 start_codon:yes stop_codon:yes gene_type:complete
MAYTQKDGFYQIPLVDFGKHLQGQGWNIGEHSEFGGNSGGHSENSYHNYDEALDITWKNNDYGDFDPSGKVSWQDHTDNLGTRLTGAGAEVLHRSKDAKGHGTHVHLAAKGGLLNFSQGQMEDFGLTGDGTSTPARAEAKTKAQDYKSMSGSELNAEYDKLRAGKDVNAAQAAGLAMHKAHFNKP